MCIENVLSTIFSPVGTICLYMSLGYTYRPYGTKEGVKDVSIHISSLRD